MLGEASIETRGSWFPATWEPVLMMVGRVPTFRQGWVKRPFVLSLRFLLWVQDDGIFQSFGEEIEQSRNRLSNEK